MRSKQIFALLIIVIGLAAVVNANVPGPLPADEDFAANAAKGGKMEVELGRLALKHARSAAVKRFGQRMVTDHTRGGMQLKRLAARKKIERKRPHPAAALSHS